MANKNDNLKNGNRFRTNDEATKIAGRKGGVNSGKTRREAKAVNEIKAQMRLELIEKIQAALLAEYTLANGKRVTGVQGLAYNLITTGMNSKNKQCIAAIKIILDIFGANVLDIDMKLKEAEEAVVRAKADMLRGADNTALEKLDDILKEMRDNADIKPETE